jgi:nitrous oxide reductase accessory protein NosL
MKKILLVLVGLSLFLVAGNIQDFRSVPSSKAENLQQGKAKKFCKICGMTLQKFYKTNHAATINGKVHQYCSIHCMIEDAMGHGKRVLNPKVIDNTTLKFIDANKAFYVVGSNKPATMSMVSKYAFGTSVAAKDFAKKFGGKIMSYGQISKIVKKNLKMEIKHIRDKQAKVAKFGKKFYNKMCKQTTKRFSNPALAKAYIKEQNLCGNIKGKPFQAVALYLSGR